MKDLHITLIQADLHWENPLANLATFEEKIWSLPEKTDLIILPEMFTTGFSMNASTLAEPMELTTFKWLKNLSAQTKAVVSGSYIIKQDNQYFNRLLWVEPNGNFDFYDKRHLFHLAGEHEIYSQGSRRIIKKINEWTVCPLICYDLRFPVWSRNTSLEFDLLLYVANWPSPRIHAWDTLLAARAIENLCYVAGVNRVGVDAHQKQYPGHSAIYNFKGEPLIKLHDHEQNIQFILSKDELTTFRDKYPFNKDADSFRLV